MKVSEIIKQKIKQKAIEQNPNAETGQPSDKARGIYEYLGYDNVMYPGRVEIHIDGEEMFVSVDQYFDGEDWIDTEERKNWDEATISSIEFFPWMDVA